MKKLKAFTLIELLVVIAIIGILAAVVITSVNDARKKSRDSRINSNVAQIRRVIELYADDHNNSYDNLRCSDSGVVGQRCDVLWGASADENLKKIAQLSADIRVNSQINGLSWGLYLHDNAAHTQAAALALLPSKSPNGLANSIWVCQDSTGVIAELPYTGVNNPGTMSRAYTTGNCKAL